MAAQNAAASVDLRVASLRAVPRAAVLFASYHGLAIVRGGAAWPDASFVMTQHCRAGARYPAQVIEA